MHRTAFSQPDIEARQWLVQRMTAAGLDAAMDRYGNVLGRTPGVRRAALVGSHTDTVPCGGWLDGALGVAYGLEISRALRARGIDAVDVVSFQDEEGTWIPCLGAKAFCGVLAETTLEGVIGPEGARLEDVMAALPRTEQSHRLDRDRHVVFLEAHIEQGPRLEAANCPIGVVTGIVGIRRFRIESTGRADHAGTTPMALRQDAGALLVEAASRVLETFRDLAGVETVWNIGAMSFAPGAANVVPEAASMIVEFRDTDPEVLDRLQEALLDIVRSAAGARLSAVSLGEVSPTELDPEVRQVIADAARSGGIEPMIMPSGAGHDCMVLAREIPTGLIFVPSIGGRSHHVSEDTRSEDIITGCRVMASAVAGLLQREPAS